VRLRTPRHATSLVRAPTFARAMQGTRGMGGVACWLTIAPWDSTTARLLDPHALPWDQSSFLARVTQGILGMVTLVQVGTMSFCGFCFSLLTFSFLQQLTIAAWGRRTAPRWEPLARTPGQGRTRAPATVVTAAMEPTAPV